MATGSPLDKTHAAALQLAIWEEEYGTEHLRWGSLQWLAGQAGGSSGSDLTSMDSYNGTAETDQAILNDAATYLLAVPSNPTDDRHGLHSGNKRPGQDLIGPPSPAITTITTPHRAATVGDTTMNDTAIVSGGNNPTGTITFNVQRSPQRQHGTDTETVCVNGDSTDSTPTGVLATARSGTDLLGRDLQRRQQQHGCHQRHHRRSR